MTAGAGRLLVVDDEEMYRRLLLSRLKRRGYDLMEAGEGNSALAMAAKSDIDVALVDVKMPGMDGIELLRRLKELDPNVEVVILTGHGNIDTAIGAMKAGAYDYLSKPYKLSELDLVVHRALEKRRLALRCAGLSAEVNRRRQRDGGVGVGRSRAWRRMMALVEKAAPLDLPVLVTGESGVGKEVVAAALHRLGARHEAPYLPLNCALLQENLLESELFGHRRGAFTGANADRDGLFHAAGEGTLFLDEIGELPPQAQAKLLRVLESGEYRPVGGSTFKRTNARLVAATNRDLEKRVASGEFRQDLYYRLNVLHVHVPPLRERVDDIPALVEHFLARSHRVPVPPAAIDADAMALLEGYRWPGNVRELRNVVERLAALHPGEVIGPRHVAPLIGQATGHAGVSADGEAGTGFGRIVPLAEMEKDYVRWVLAQCAENVSHAAKRLGISRSTIYRMLR